MTHLGGGVAGPGDEGPLVRTEAEGHDVPRVAGVHLDLLAGLHVPEGAGHVPAGGHNLTVVDEPTAGEVASVPGQFPGDPGVPLASI